MAPVTTTAFPSFISNTPEASEIVTQKFTFPAQYGTQINKCRLEQILSHSFVTIKQIQDHVCVF